MEIFNKVCKIFSELSGVVNISPEQLLKENLGLDSLQMITLLIMIEENFQIVLDESDMNPFDLITVSDVVNLVKKYTDGDGNAKAEKES